MVVVTSLGPPEEGLRHTEPNTLTYINEKGLGKGSLYISESRVSWVGDAGHKFSLEYEHIALHAVSRDTSGFPHSEHLYLMIDKKLVDSDGMPTPTSTPESSDVDDEDEADDGEDMTEIRFVPENKDCLQDLFKAMSECQALHPDPADSDQEAEADMEGGEGEDDDEEGEGEGEDGEDDAGAGQFDDAEEGQDGAAMDTA